MLCYFILDEKEGSHLIKKLPITLEQVPAIRSNTIIMQFEFIEHFLSTLIGKTFYKANKYEKLLLEYAAISNEALTNLLPKNNLNVWQN